MLNTGQWYPSPAGGSGDAAPSSQAGKTGGTGNFCRLNEVLLPMETAKAITEQETSHFSKGKLG